MFGHHLDIPRIPGRPLGCCKACRQRARYGILRRPVVVCPRCGLPKNRIRELLDVKQFIVFEDSQGNVITRIRLK